VINNAGVYNQDVLINKVLTSYTLQEGAITFGSLGDTGANAMLVNGVALTTGGSGTSSSLSSPISGAGSLDKVGIGTMTLQGTTANTYAGATTVNGGVLALNKSAGVNAIPAGATVAGAELRVLGTQQIPDSAAITLNAGGVFRVHGGGSENLNAYPTQSTASSDVQVGGTLQINGAVTQTTGLTTLDGGLLRVGSTGTAVLNLNGGTLQGTGAVQAQMVNNAARIDPGTNTPATAAGTITIQGNLNTTGTIHIDLQNTSVFDKIAVVQNTNLGPVSGGYIGATPTAVNGTVKFGGAIETGAITGSTPPISTPPSPSSYVGVMTFEYRLLGDTFNGADPNRSRLPSDFATKSGLAFAGGPLDSRFQTSTNQNNARSQYSSPTGLLTNPKNLASNLAKKLTLTALAGPASSHTAKATPTGADTYVKTLAPTAINYGGSMHNFVMVQSIKNNTAATIVGPIYLEVTVPPGSTAKLFNSAGTTGAGKPYVVIQNASIAPGATAVVNVELDFLCPTASLPVQAGQALLGYRILAGGLP
jgi:autotransporter-associated beta strand protein